MTRVLELFSGTGSVSKVCDQLGYEVVSVDINDQYHEPTIKTDIMTWDYKSEYPVGYFDTVWASPPCNTFSPINRQFRSVEEIRQRCDQMGVPLLRKAEEIIDYFNPRVYIIENPLGYMKDYITNRPMYKVDYCRYADWGYQKPTCVWTNHVDFKPLRCQSKCNSRIQNTKRHTHTLLNKKNRAQGAINTLHERYRVPPLLISQLLI
jgi:site-specific DNA-cytosine methylase